MFQVHAGIHNRNGDGTVDFPLEKAFRVFADSGFRNAPGVRIIGILQNSLSRRACFFFYLYGGVRLRIAHIRQRFQILFTLFGVFLRLIRIIELQDMEFIRPRNVFDRIGA